MAGKHINQSWFKKYMSKESLPKLESLIGSAEKSSSGEVVICLAKSSGNYSYFILLPFILLFFLLYFLINLLSQYYSIFLPYNKSLIFFSFVALILGIGFLLFRKSSFITKYFVPYSVKFNNVFLQAKSEYYQLGVDRTQNKTGVLIYISFLEKEVVVLADEGISKLVAENYWDDIVQIVSSSLKSYQLELGLEMAVERCGELFSEKFNIDMPKVNELSNFIVIRD